MSLKVQGTNIASSYVVDNIFVQAKNPLAYYFRYKVWFLCCTRYMYCVRVRDDIFTKLYTYNVSTLIKHLTRITRCSCMVKRCITKRVISSLNVEFLMKVSEMHTTKAKAGKIDPVNSALE